MASNESIPITEADLEADRQYRESAVAKKIEAQAALRKYPELVQPQPPDNSPMALLRLALDKGADPEKLKALMDLAERWEARQAAIAFGEAITAFQAACPPVVKGNPVKDRQGNVMYSFASFDDLMEIAGPIMAKLKIAVTYDTNFANGLMSTTAKVRVGSHVESTTVTLGLPAIPNANDSQKAGGALAYGQRYALKAALGIVVTGEDRDAAEQFQGISDGQAEELNGLLEQVHKKAEAVPKSTPESWDKWLKAFWQYCGCTDMNDLKAKDFERAKDRLTKAVKA